MYGKLGFLYFFYFVNFLKTRIINAAKATPTIIITRGSIEGIFANIIAPATITNTPVGLESIIAGFVVGGVAAVIYEELFKKRIKFRKSCEIYR